jgi:hypothetical protein
MAWFRKDSEKATKKNVDNAELEEVFEFPFEVLWQDEEKSQLILYGLSIVQIVVLIYVAFKV